jgi:hypothetical protein
MPSSLLIPAPSGFLDLGLFLKAFFKTTYSLAQALPQLREALRAEDKKRNRENDYKFLHTETKHKIISF